MWSGPQDQVLDHRAATTVVLVLCYDYSRGDGDGLHGGALDSAVGPDRRRETGGARHGAAPGRSVMGSHDVARPRDLVRPWILLLLAEAPSHGYELIHRLREIGFDWGGAGGPIYRELRILLGAEMIRMSVTSARPAGPRRKAYELTPEGWAELARLAKAASDLSTVSLDFVARHATLRDRAGLDLAGPACLPPS